MSTEELKVQFEIEQDEDDWPPYAVEYVWCSSVAGGLKRVNNVPYFVQGVSFQDVIKTKVRQAVEWFDCVSSHSGFSVVQIFCFDEQKRAEVYSWAIEQGCIFEAAYKGKYFVLGIPPSLPIKIWLEKLEALESLDDDGFEFEIATLRHL